MDEATKRDMQNKWRGGGVRGEGKGRVVGEGEGGECKTRKSERILGGGKEDVKAKKKTKWKEENLLWLSRLKLVH